MQKMKLLAAEILTRLTHLKNTRKYKREFVIVSTIVAGMLLSWLLFRDNNALSRELAVHFDPNGIDPYTLYHTHLAINFIKSLAMLLLCFLAVMATDSIRLSYGMTTVIALSMLMDLVSILSPEAYGLLKFCRYENYYNFKDFYTTLEVVCVLYTFINWTWMSIKSKLENPVGRTNAFCSPPSSQNTHAHKKKTT